MDSADAALPVAPALPTETPPDRRGQARRARAIQRASAQKIQIAQINSASTARTFRCELVTLDECELPLTPQSAGRVYCTYADGRSGALYPSVIGARFIEGDAPEGDTAGPNSLERQSETEQTASKETARAKAMKLISENPRFTEAPPSGTGYVIGGTKSDPDRHDAMLDRILKAHPDLSRDAAILMLKQAGY